jgi:tetraacyldisaccharide 4'-kinase
MKIWKFLLFPFSFIYGFVMNIRNLLFDVHFFKSYEIPGKSITIGNLSMGGTGKSPHTLYLWKLLYEENTVSFLSRGYGRKTKGLIEVTDESNAETTGDEPLMFKKRAKNTALVVVSENRENGIKYIHFKNANSVILLDDAYQHRKVKAGFSILLTDFHQPFFSDYVVPMGNLREWRKGKDRANCIIVTKCPENVSLATKNNFLKQIKPTYQSVYFSSIKYDELISFSNEKISDFKNLLLVTGIADPTPLLHHLSKQYQVELIRFNDHHNFEIKDIESIHQKFDTFATDGKGIIVTTEKDFVRLSQPIFSDLIQQYPWYYQPITIIIDNEESFKKEIINYVRAI